MIICSGTREICPFICEDLWEKKSVYGRSLEIQLLEKQDNRQTNPNKN